MRVILADDSVLIMERLQNVVNLFPQAELVGSFNNGTDTLEAIRRLKPDLAIVDIKMPGMTGLEVLAEIRKADTDVTFIILTFFSSDYHRHLALAGGADYFFSKVDDFEKVSAVVASLLEKTECKPQIC